MNQLATGPQLQERPAKLATTPPSGIWVARDRNGWIFAYVNCPLWTGEEFVPGPGPFRNDCMEIDERMYPGVLPGRRLQLVPGGSIEDCRGLKE